MLSSEYKMKHPKNPKRSVNLGSVRSYRTEYINEMIAQTQEDTELLMYFIYYIRNYNALSDEMMETIKQLDDNSKMLLIIEYNTAIKTVNILLE